MGFVRLEGVGGRVVTVFVREIGVEDDDVVGQGVLRV